MDTILDSLSGDDWGVCVGLFLVMFTVGTLWRRRER
jgi:hypothetical protein